MWDTNSSVLPQAIKIEGLSKEAVRNGFDGDFNVRFRAFFLGGGGVWFVLGFLIFFF